MRLLCVRRSWSLEQRSGTAEPRSRIIALSEDGWWDHEIRWSNPCWNLKGEYEEKKHPTWRFLSVFAVVRVVALFSGRRFFAICKSKKFFTNKPETKKHAKKTLFVCLWMSFDFFFSNKPFRNHNQTGCTHKNLKTKIKQSITKSLNKKTRTKRRLQTKKFRW